MTGKTGSYVLTRPPTTLSQSRLREDLHEVRFGSLVQPLRRHADCGYNATIESGEGYTSLIEVPFF